MSALIQQRNEYLAAHGACKAAREAQLDLVRVYINRDHFYSRQFLEVGKAANELRRLTSLTPGSLFKQTLNEFRDTFSHGEARGERRHLWPHRPTQGADRARCGEFEQ